MLALGLILTTSQTLWAANKKTTVAQVTSSVTLTDDVDYIISSATPFGDNGVVDISNTEHAVLILAAVKPSAAINLLSKHVQVAGQRAVYNTNCQVKLYNRGCIIMPYDNSFKPLTVYSEPNFEGESCNDFGLEHTGGYMNTLTDAKLNNKIRSFKLKPMERADAATVVASLLPMQTWRWPRCLPCWIEASRHIASLSGGIQIK